MMRKNERAFARFFRPAALGAALAASAVLMTAGAAFADVTDTEAEKAVLEAAALPEEQVVLAESTLDFENGKWVYNIDYVVPGDAKYEYSVDCVTGEILKSEKDAWDAEDDAEYARLVNSFMEPLRGEELEKAYKKCLEDAGVDESSAIMKKNGTDYDDGRQIIVVDFLLPGEAVYEYDLDPTTLNIIKKDSEPWEAEDDQEYKALINPAEATASSAEKSAAAPSGEVDEAGAKAIALKDAGLSESDVTFTKSKKDVDDGLAIFEIEFRTSDGMEYNYDIAVEDGRIVEKDVEKDD